MHSARVVAIKPVQLRSRFLSFVFLMTLLWTPPTVVQQTYQKCRFQLWWGSVLVWEHRWWRILSHYGEYFRTGKYMPVYSIQYPLSEPKRPPYIKASAYPAVLRQKSRTGLIQPLSQRHLPLVLAKMDKCRFKPSSVKPRDLCNLKICKLNLGQKWSLRWSDWVT